MALLQISGVARLVADAEVKFSNEKSKLIEFRVANNKRMKQGNEWIDRPSFVTLKQWVYKSSKLPDYLKKGTQVWVVSGELEEDRWETDGQKRSKHVVNVIELELVGGKATAQPQGQPTTPSAPAEDVPTQEAPAQSGAPIEEDDIPF